ncbi:hypothetical protein [Phthorimaea operculella granulovirus]|uniref:Uncharacterized protein n=1 Tax=Phthorimaea operculella granulovirus TaxID=192584 RepID=Q8JS14_9BBAC|nr:hypothetical protein [Phthorimaea operculella granulovirus]AAM70243.1 hypothetical protein [Phthorimaea operculella granulovirus]QBH65880.1 hypothetical protein PhopGVgp045 [Phthorimaea operculella granulovirus]QBH66010.1 hypothetical protein PhopGVgp045 [Phthorimaea operculella granulovirus]QBH66140.1 hypothetical protein PhopGVgp045 [Phthorimaea operculella granulovirus]QBH66270.1 hypothetical protein PhopGVgp045 [Phthorimaea operculella granulovirus]
MDKNVDIVLESFEVWMNDMYQRHRKVDIVSKLLVNVDILVRDYLEEKRKKYIKIDNMNRLLFDDTIK